MKKIVYIILFIMFVSFISISSIKADSVTPTYLYNIDKCIINVNGSRHWLNPRTDLNAAVYVYDSLNENHINNSYDITHFQGDMFIVASSDILVSTCDNTLHSANANFFRHVSNLNIDPYNDISTSFSSSHRYIYIYESSNYESYVPLNSWGNSTSVEETPTIPHVTILDHDFYLFYDFDTISDFDILSSYTFTNFTDFEKLVIVMLFNIFYLGFIFACIYIILKALYKLVSWVFR